MILLGWNYSMMPSGIDRSISKNDTNEEVTAQRLTMNLCANHYRINWRVSNSFPVASYSPSDLHLLRSS
jgi:hypothetical protein